MPRRKIAPARKAGNPHRTPPPRRRKCRHCGVRKYIQHRGLCNRCYYTPAIRRVYPPTNPRGKRYADVGRVGALPEKPTSAAPGSPEKIEVMTERAGRRRSLFHPSDVSMDPEIDPGGLKTR